MTLDKLNDLKEKAQKKDEQGFHNESESIVSFHSKVPVQLHSSMNKFIERYPNWDQHRLIQAALAGFLVQNGVESRSINRLYISNMFNLNSL